MGQTPKPIAESRILYEGESKFVDALDSPFDKVYWFARMLVNSEFGGIGGKSREMLQLVQLISLAFDAVPFDLAAALTGIKVFLRRVHKPGTKVAAKIERLVEELDAWIDSPKDLQVFKFTIEHVIVPTNLLIDQVPSSDREIAETMIRAYLGEEGEAALASVIEMWDKAGRMGSMRTERVQVVTGFRILRKTLEEMLEEQSIKQLDADQALTAFVQEFERRLSRGVRPARAGRSLEDVTGVILDHFEVEDFSDAPDHVKSAFEVDKLITLPSGWRIGVSCKRTLRERWKQAATLNAGILDESRIKSTWHVITLPGDLSVAKVEAIGESRGVVYVPDSSHFYQMHANNPELSTILRPMSSFVRDIRSAVESTESL